MEYYAIICRLCASLDQTGRQLGRTVFPKNDQVLPMIRACANIVIFENDELPQRICGRCYQNVELSYNFKMQCEETDAKLRHEIALLAINSEDSKLPAPSFLVDRNETKVDVTLAVDRVFVKTEVEEDEDEGQVMLAGESDEELCLAKTDLKLEIELDWNPYKNEPSESEGSDDESEDAVQCEDAKLRHEIALLAKNSEGKLTVPSFLVDRKEAKVDVTLAADKVVIKTEVEEDDDTGQAKLAGESDDEICLAKMDGELKIELDWNAYKNEPSDSKNGDGLDGDEKPTPNATPPTQQSHVCEICGKKFNNRKNLNSHNHAVHGPKPYKCSQCSKCYLKKSCLQSHEAAQHEGIRQFECQQCDKKYASQPGLKSHMQDVHSDNFPYVCDRCGKKYATPSKLGSHYLVHIEARDVICDICNRGFKNNSRLNYHKITFHNTHTGEKKYECHICFKRFNSERSQRKHKLVHTGKRPHVCQYCQQAFLQKHQVNRHIRVVHFNDKPFKCKFCPRAFAAIWTLRRHAMSHDEPTGSSKQ